MSKNTPLILMICTSFAVFSASADVCSESDCLESSQLIESYRCLIHKVGVVDEDGRKTEEEYATAKLKPISAVQNRFSPTGILKCNGSRLSAQLTGGTNVITTAGHAFVDLKDCKKISSPETCTFTVKIGSTERVSRISKLAKTGIECPRIPETSDDWAVLTIDPPLEGITPYEVPDKIEIQADEDVIAVSAFARDFVKTDPTTKRKILPKSIEECRTKKTYGPERVLLAESNCDFARGNSGGSLLKVVSGRDVLMGISTANRESEAQLQAAEKRGKPNSGAYQKNVWTTFHVPLNGDFRDAVIKEMNGRSI